MASIAFENHPARLAAVAAGGKHFDTGEPCANSHRSPRYVSNGICVECLSIRQQARSAVGPPQTSKPEPTGRKSHGSASRLGKAASVVKRPHRASAKRHAEHVAAGSKLFDYRPPRFPGSYELASYARSDEARTRSKYLDNLIRSKTHHVTRR
jgi:hypothetical protein